MQGKIVKWVADRGFGFVRGDNGEEHFCHVSAFGTTGHHGLNPQVGARLEYQVGVSGKDGRLKVTTARLLPDQLESGGPIRFGEAA